MRLARRLEIEEGTHPLEFGLQAGAVRRGAGFAAGGVAEGSGQAAASHGQIAPADHAFVP